MICKSPLTLLANVLTIGLCCFLGISYADRRSDAARKKTALPIISKQTKATLGIDDHRVAVVLAISPFCRYCNASAPFYRELRKRCNGKAQMIVASSSDLVRTASYMKRMEIEADSVRPILFTQLNVNATPTLFVFRNGKVIRSWIGQLPKTAEKQVFDSF